MKSWFGFSKETSPDRERLRQEVVRQEEEDRRRVQEHYDRLRQREAQTNRNLSATSFRQQPVVYQQGPYPAQVRKKMAVLSGPGVRMGLARISYSCRLPNSH